MLISSIFSKILFSSIIIFVIIFNALSQDKSNIRYKSDNTHAIKLYEKANQYFRKRELSSGISELKKCIKKHPYFYDAYWLMAQTFEILGLEDSAFNYIVNFSKVIPPNSMLPADAYTISQRYYNKGKYNEAQQFIPIFKQKVTDWNKNTKFVRLAESIQYSIDNLNNVVNYSTELLPKNVNNFYSQYFPTLTVDGKTIIFTARKGGNPYDDENIFFSSLDESGNWSIAKSISNVVNTNANEGACAISADGRTLIFTSCEEKKTIGSCDLFYAEKIGDKWTNVKNLGEEVNSSAWESQPSLSSDGKTLYFSSNRVGGKGGRDIWVTYNNNGVWTTPVNLGSNINTEFDELTPYIHFNNQTLFFSSAGHLGFGGFDIFISEKTNDTTWSFPKNFGYSINDHNDQLALIITSDGTEGYYGLEELNSRGEILSKIVKVSFRKEIETDNDSVTISDTTKAEEITFVSQRVTYVVGKVFDEDTKLPLSAKIRLHQLNNSNQKYETKSDSIDGTYTFVLNEGVEYGVFVEKKNYIFEEFQFKLEKNSELENFVIDIPLKRIKKDAKLELKNIFFELNSYKLDQKSIAVLNEIKNFIINNKVKIEISGHTDKTGTQQYNQELSLQRAKAVYTYLIENGIEAEQLTFVGFGSSQPKYLKEEESDKNRRIEFKILSENNSVLNKF